MDNIENNKNTQWENVEQKGSNRLKEKWEAVKDFLKWKKDAEELNVEEEAKDKAGSLADKIGKEQLEDLHNKIESTFEKQGIIEDTRDALSDFFKEGEKEFSDDVQPIDEDGINYEAEVASLMNSKRFKNRSLWVVRGIAKSAENIKSEILHWEKEKSLVAKTLFRIINRIIGTEK